MIEEEAIKIGDLVFVSLKIFKTKQIRCRHRTFDNYQFSVQRYVITQCILHCGENNKATAGSRIIVWFRRTRTPIRNPHLQNAPTVKRE